MVTTLQQLLVHGGFVSRRQPYGDLVDTDFARPAIGAAA
jgi:hypothetical protein